VPLSERERAYLESARVGRLATADTDGRPHAVPICFALVDGEESGEAGNGPPALVSPIDEKPKTVGPSDLRRVRDVRENPAVALVVDHYREDWDRLGWMQVRGRASMLDPDASGHAEAVAALQRKYDQYRDHALEERPVLRITIGHVVPWGELER